MSTLVNAAGLSFVIWQGDAYFTPIQPEMTIRWTSEVPS